MLNYIDNNINKTVRSMTSGVSVSTGTDTYTFRENTDLQSWEISRVGENNKFFGYGVLQKINVKIRDVNKNYNIPAGATLRVHLSAGYIGVFTITETHRDETTNQLSITAYDKLYWASAHTLAEIDTTGNKTYADWINKIGTALGFSSIITTGMSDELSYVEAPNIELTETFRDMLNDIAEATQTIYFVRTNFLGKDVLVFKQLSILDEENALENVDYKMTADSIFSISTGANRRLKALCSATALGDNVEASIETSGTTQYIRDNVFYTACEDVETLLNEAIATWGGFTLGQYTVEWRGDYRLEPGDSIAIDTSRGNEEWIIGVAINDTLTYNGSFKMKSEWNFKEDEAETANASTLGEVLKQTYAKVDKVNKEIDILVSTKDELQNSMSEIKLTTDTITAKVENTDRDISQIKSAVINMVSANDMRIEIEKAIGDINSITTSTGFTFNESGLDVSKSDSEMTTNISEDGMKIVKNSETVLTANNQGVDAKNLHATTYLIIGVNSRFEDYDNNSRTGCFWIGG